MLINIHRGTHQIGGVVTEISTDKAKIFIDLGANLPNSDDAPLPPIDGLTVGNGSKTALFITHYHGDHIGAVGAALSSVQIYMGETAKGIHLAKTRKIAPAVPEEKELLPRYEQISTLRAPDPLQVGDITVTPLFVDHSAFDAYMFVIEADGVRVLHTGDFRNHGMRSKALPKILRAYARNIDYLISEGTMLSRIGEQVMTEHELGQEAQKLIHGKKNVFILCSSTNIDRIAVFYHANRHDDPKRKCVVDGYQKDVLNVVQGRHAEFSSFYEFGGAMPWYPKYKDALAETGLCAFIRTNRWSKELLDRYFDPSNSLLIYSMWSGYLKDGKNQNEEYRKLMEQYKPNAILHTSGHASTETLVELYKTVKPKRGLIPMHSENPEGFKELLPGANIIMLGDGEVLEVN